ncbi:hypothetical protein Tco_0849049 [Tanacetum coccineum]
MVADLRYFHSLEKEGESLQSQLGLQQTKFSNEIDRLSREYFYADYMNAILGYYTKLDELANFLEISNLFQYGENQEEAVVKLEQKISQGLRNHQAIIENLERHFEYLNEKSRHTKSLPRTTNTKPRHEIIYKPPSIRNENNKGDLEFIEEDEIKPIPIVLNLKQIKSNSPTVSPFLKDYTVHIPYPNAKTFADDVLSNHVGGKELNSIDGIETGRITKKKIKKKEMGLPKEPNK